MSYKDKHVCVTGGAGMIGSHLVEFLLEDGATVTVLDNFSRGRTRVEGARIVVCDVGDYAESYLHYRGVDVVFNLAAEVAGVGFNASHSLFMFERNLRLQMTPVKAALDAGVERFLQVSSVCVYPEEYAFPAVENLVFAGSPTPANEGYALAKRMGERIAHWSGVDCVIVRPTNVYGPRDYTGERAHVVPALIRKCLEDDVIVVNGSPNVVRELIYVEDVARGMMAAAERGKPGEAYNLGTSGRTATTIDALLREIRNLTGTLDKPVEWRQMYDGGESIRTTNSTKAESELDWMHEVSLREGLARTIEAYRQGRLQ